MIIRNYACIDCETEWECIVEDSSAPDPECPNPDCNKILQWVPTRFAVKTNKSRAMDITQEIMETDYGLTNWKDNNREGDVAAMGPPAETTSAKEERIKMEREIAEMAVAAQPKLPEAQVAAFWGGAHGGAPANNITARNLLESAKVGMNDPSHRDPIKILHDRIKAGAEPRPEQMRRIVGRWRPGQT